MLGLDDISYMSVPYTAGFICRLTSKRASDWSLYYVIVDNSMFTDVSLSILLKSTCIRYRPNWRNYCLLATL